jgi:hypothetical protein
MKTTTILASFLIIISQASFANQTEGNKRLDMSVLITQLQLDEGKAQQLESIMQSHHQKMKLLHQKRQQNRKDGNTLRNQHRKQLLTILDHQQLYQLETYMQQHRPKRKPPQKMD